MTEQVVSSNGAAVPSGPSAARNGRYTAAFAALLLLSIFTAGCQSLFGSRIVVPDYATARQQAENAEWQYRRARQSVDESQRNREYRKAVAALQKVEERFPDDRVYTPAAAALLGEVYFSMGEFRRAERVYRRVIREYSDIEDVHATALFGLAQTLGEQKRHRDEKEYYQQLIDTYSGSEIPAVRSRVAIAQRRYRQIETQ